MRKLTFAFLALALAVGITSPALASTDVMAVKDVKLEILPAIVIGATGVAQDSFQPESAIDSEVYVDIPYLIDANKQTLYLQAYLSKLFKGDDPQNPDNVPPLVPCEFVELFIEFGSPVDPMDGIAVAEFGGEYDTIDGFPSVTYEPVLFESSQNNRFSQTATIRGCWVVSTSEQPMGFYSGKAKLRAFIMP